MFELEKQIAEWRAEISRAGLHNPEVLDELEAHLREQVAHLQGIGLSEAEQFRIAVGRIGEIRAIKNEFSKVNGFRFWLPRENPTELNIAALVFIFSGLNVICSTTRLFFMTWVPDTSPLAIIGMLTVNSLFGLQFFIGLGLLHRRNFWRKSAFAIGAPQVIYTICNLWVIYGVLKDSVSGNYFPSMGVMIPMRFHWIPDVITIVMVIWACVYLSKPAVRNLFRSGDKIATA